MKTYAVSEVFTPTKPAKLTFVERGDVNGRLVNALSTPGKQIIVYGHSGSGKTTLLVNKLNQLYERHITTRCTKGMSFEQIVLDAFDQLAPFYQAEINKKELHRTSAAVQVKYASIQGQLGSVKQNDTASTNMRMLPPQLTVQTLARLLGEAHACWVLEDFHKVDASEKTELAQSMKVFMDMSDEYPDLKIVALGAVDTARQVIEFDPEMRNRVSEIYVPLMGESELCEILKKAEGYLNVSFVKSVREGIVRYSNGLAGVCHNLCLNICQAIPVYQTCPTSKCIGKKELRKGLEQYLQEASDTLKAVFDNALRRKKSGKYDNCKLIIKALTHFEQEGARHGEIIARIHQEHKTYPSGNCTYYLKELQKPERGSIIRNDTVSGRYSFSDPIYRAFAITMFEKQHDQPGALDEVFKISLGDLHKELEELVLRLNIG